MKLTLLLFLQITAVFPMQTYTGISRQNFGVEFLENLKKEGRVRFGKSSRFTYSDVIEDLFNVYDPSFLAFVWPKLRTGVHLNIGNACWDDFGIFFKDLLQGRTWAYGAVDASGRYNPGLLDGNHYWLGSKRECFQLENSFLKNSGNDSFHEFRNSDYLNHLQRQGSGEDWKYLMEQDELMQRILEAEKVPPFRLMYTTAKVLIDVTKPTMMKSFPITLGLCVPRSCTFEDIKHVLDFSVMINDNLKTNKTTTRTVKIYVMKRLEDTYNLKHDPGALVLLLFTILIIIVVVIATVVDLELISLRPINAKSMSFDLERPPTVADNPLSLSLDAMNLEYLGLTKPEKIYGKTMPRTHNCMKKHQQKRLNVDLDSLTINNMNNSNNINLVTVKKISKADTEAPSITLDVVAVDEKKGCRRCGKYKKQCANSKESDKLTSCQRTHKYNTIDAVKTSQDCKKESLFRSLLKCFSLSNSIQKIFNTNMANKDLLAVHLLKIIATYWMIYIHVCLIICNVSINGGDVFDINSKIFSVGTFAFDTLFYVSGVLSAHHFFYLKSQYTTKELVSFGGTFGQILQVICFVTNRAIRMLPSYMYVLFLGAYISRRHRWTSALEVPENDYITCTKYWWRNFLYINTFYDREERCMQWSWYLSLESQLHVAGVLWLSVLRRWRLALFTVTVAMATAVTADVVNHMAHYTDSLPNMYAVYESFIERGWARPTPYFVGLFTGWMVHRLEGQMKVSKMTSTCLWASSVVVLLSLFVRPWSESLGATADIVLSSLSHSVWALALTWPAVVIACHSSDWARRILSGSCIAALSRLTYGVILIHGVVARVLVLGADSPVSMDTGTMVTYFICTTIASILGSFVLSVLVETPCCSLLRRLTDCANT